MAVDPTAVRQSPGFWYFAAMTVLKGKKYGYDCYPYPDRYKREIHAIADHLAESVVNHQITKNSAKAIQLTPPMCM